MYHDTITTEITGELSQQLDGIRKNGPAVFVLGATNRDEGVDPAILSRFVEQVEVGLPEEAGRQQVLKVFLVNSADDGEGVARFRPGYSARGRQRPRTSAS